MGAGLAAFAGDKSWDGFRQEISISDVTRPQTLELHKGRRGLVYALDYEVAGQLDGDAELVLLLAGRDYETMPLAGAVAGKRGGDWYADTAVVEYRPQSVRSGGLQLNYLFRALR